MQEDITRQQKERSTWDRAAASYDHNNLRTYRKAYDLSIEKALAQVKPTDLVLDIGSGTGILALALAPHVKRVMGVDISPKMVSAAQAKAAAQGVANVDFKEIDGYDLPFREASFDHVLLFNVLHVVKHPSRVLKEAHRVLKPGGWLISATDCNAEPAPLKTRAKLSLQRLLKTLGLLPYLRFYHQETVEQLLRRNAFIPTETAVLHAAPMNYYVLAQKV